MDFRRRLLLLYLLTAAALAVVWGRTFWIQVVDVEAWREEASKRDGEDTRVRAPRGRILDAAGTPLAEDRSVVQLAFVPGEWATRERFRCRTCGAVDFRTTPRFSNRPDRPATPRRRCSCGADRSHFEALPSQDLAPLEDALNLPPGTLADRAEDQMEKIDLWVEAAVIEKILGREEELQRGSLRREAARDKVPLAEVIERWKPKLEGEEFLADDLRRSLRSGWWSQSFTFTTFRLPSYTESVVRREISDEAERLLELDVAGRYRGFQAVTARIRHYPESGLLAQVVGFTRPFRDREERLRYAAVRDETHVTHDTDVGRTGLEAQYDVDLAGSAGLVHRSRRGEGGDGPDVVLANPRRGEDLRLHLTIPACKEAFVALRSEATDAGYGLPGPASGGFVVLDAQSGALLAWADTPMFDLNSSLEDVVTKLEDDEEAQARRDASEGDDAPTAVPSTPGVGNSRVASVVCEAGSSMKIATVLAFLEGGHPLREDYYCYGPRKPGVDPAHDKPHCHMHPSPVGPEVALGCSCNRWCADTAYDPAYRGEHVVLLPTWADRLGIGKPTGLDLPNERAGSFPSPASLTREPWKLRQVSIGQSMLATPMQMARIAAFVANGKGLPIPRLAASIGGAPVPGGLVPVACNPAALARVRAGMRACVVGDHGTARGAFDLPGLEGVTVFGKTGTATATGGFSPKGVVFEHGGPYHLWFVGYASKPGTRTVAFAMVLHARKEEHAAGGSSAAPAVARFLAWWYAHDPR